MSLAKETFDRIKKLKDNEIENLRDYVYTEIDNMTEYTQSIPYTPKYSFNSVYVVSKELQTHGFETKIMDGCLNVSVSHLEEEK